MEKQLLISLPPAPYAPQQAGPDSITFIGTATTLIKHGGFTILTDPNFLHAGEHADLGYGLKSERLTNPALEIDQLPPLDLCVLSHYHGDHWDEVASANLRKDLPIVTTRQAAAAVEKEGFTNTYGMDTWQVCRVTRGTDWLNITAMPGRHGPPVVNMVLPDVQGSMLEWGNEEGIVKNRLYISGDTLVYDDIKEIARRYSDIPLALLHLGGTKVMGVLVTMDAKQGLEMVHILQPDHIIPIHYNDYTVFESPVEDFLQAAQQAGIADRVTFLKHGEQYLF